MLIKNLIQVAGIIDMNEAHLLTQAGVNFLGFPLRLPVHKEDLSEEEAAAIIRSLSKPFFGVLITYLSEASLICDLTDFLGTKVVQIHGEITIEEIRKLKRLRPDLSIFKSLVVKHDNLEDLLNKALQLAPYVDAFITDTFDPVSGASGATGKTHDWEVSKKLVSISPKPVILAGGLTPYNVREAIETVRPAGVDAHTGVEGSDGRKDIKLVRMFVEEARRGFALITD